MYLVFCGGWFVVPVFHLPVLTVAPAIGIAMVVSFLTHQIDLDTQKKDQSFGKKIGDLLALAIVKPLLVLLFGWVVQFFV
ncbi:hypothetical protein ISS03_05060 [Patescibacteria group bacterium]|nr:hypothetical protein [Patescibacteria group bacterium]